MKPCGRWFAAFVKSQHLEFLFLGFVFTGFRFDFLCFSVCAQYSHTSCSNLKISSLTPSPSNTASIPVR